MLRAYLELLRPANVVTAVADGTVGEVQLFQRLPPPRQAHQADHRFARRGDDLPKLFIQLEQGGKRNTLVRWRIGDRQRALRIDDLGRCSRHSLPPQSVIVAPRMGATHQR